MYGILQVKDDFSDLKLLLHIFVYAMRYQCEPAKRNASPAFPHVKTQFLFSVCIFTNESVFQICIMDRYPRIQDIVVAARAGDADDGGAAARAAARGLVADAPAHRPPLVRAQRPHRAHRRQVLPQPRGAQGNSALVHSAAITCTSCAINCRTFPSYTLLVRLC